MKVAGWMIGRTRDEDIDKSGNLPCSSVASDDAIRSQVLGETLCALMSSRAEHSEALSSSRFLTLLL